MILRSTDTHYNQLCARIDNFIRERLERGDFETSTKTTEHIYDALGSAFPEENDAIATFAERIADHNVETLQDALTGVDVFVGLRLRTDDVPSSPPAVAL